MQYFLDISLLALIALTIVIYWRRGLIRSLMGAAKTVLSIILTYMFGDMAATWLEQTYMLPSLSAFVKERLQALFVSGAQSFDLSSVFAQMPDWLRNLLMNFHVDVGALEEEYALVTQGSSTQLDALASSIATPVAALLSTAVGYAVVFLVANLLLTIVAFLLVRIAELPVIRTFDRALGLVLGLLCAILYSSRYVMLIYMLLGWVEVSNPEIAFSSGFDASWIFQYAYKFNLFKILFGI